jgi:hypothetical protein
MSLNRATPGQHGLRTSAPAGRAGLVCVLALAGAACAAAGEETGGGRGGRGGTSAGGSAGGGSGAGGAAGDDFGSPGPAPMSDRPPPPSTVDVGAGEECAAEGSQAESEVRPVDIIWAVDSSSSMFPILDAMAMQMNNLVNTVTMAAIDVRIIMITAPWREDLIFSEPMVGNPVLCVGAPVGSGACPDDSNPPGYTHVTQCTTDMNEGCWVGSHNALQRFQDAYPVYMGTLRDNSIKYFGVVSDDTAGDTMDFAGQANAFEAWVSTLGPPGAFDGWKFFGIISPALGGAYQMLADRTGGTTGVLSLTPGDYTALFMMLAQTVTSKKELACEWAIPAIPESAGQFDKRKVNVTYSPGDGSPPTQFGKVPSMAECAMAAMGGWYYDDDNAPTKVLVCPQNCDVMKADFNGRVDVLFGCSTVDAPL